ncbi:MULTISPECIES: Fic family protein [Sphingobium]|uniref:Fic family protein n=1 Tax=Sphingobium sp. MI1205 TaxID=407020 RepID=UPI0007700F73|nr:Fic family protein [Sphingobium sp. MI1205]AMK19632.1 filamentation induced by cAMP protein fic [Sphingobium sp. MI1205]
MVYIYERPEWPTFRWNTDALATKLASVRHRQGLLLGRMSALGFESRSEAVLATLTETVLKSSEIEGEHLDKNQVRSSIARRLGMDIAGLVSADRHVEGVVEMMLDATQNYATPLTADRLFAWHAAMFPTGRSGMSAITVGAWRTDENGPMQVVSGPVGREKVHFQATPAPQVDAEMTAFLDWFETPHDIDPVIMAGIAHLWFVTIHPFEDGNGRIARAIADLALARSEASAQRFYSMSSQIRAERNAYYDQLERAQKADLDITSWLDWFLACLGRAFEGAERELASVLAKAQYWDRHRATPINDRQREMVNRLLNGFVGKLNTSKWAKITDTSPDTALRDIQDLIEKGMLVRDEGGGRSTSYSLNNIRQ